MDILGQKNIYWHRLCKHTHPPGDTSGTCHDTDGKAGDCTHPSYCCIAPQVPLPFEGQSQYAADFVAKQAEPLAAAAAPPLRQPLPFEGQSTYQQEFIAKRGECAELPQVTSARVALPFEGNSEYAREFSAGCGSQNRGRTGNVSVI